VRKAHEEDAAPAPLAATAAHASGLHEDDEGA
jgi:hypothetical protein